MGSAASSESRQDRYDGDGDDEEEEEEDDDDDDDDNEDKNPDPISLYQEPETLLHPFTSATPLSPQLSSSSSFASPPLLGPAVKVFDPCNFLLRPPPPPDATAEVFLVSHGECTVGIEAGLTVVGERQVRALAVFLGSMGLGFGAVYSSPLAPARTTAGLVCRELNFLEEQIQICDALIEMCQGKWEGLPRVEAYNPETVRLIGRTQPDFSAPSGESLRQVEFRMIEFMNRTVLGLPKKMKPRDPLMQQNEAKTFSYHSSTNLLQDIDGPHESSRQDITRKKFGKSRLHVVSTGSKEVKDETFAKELNRELLHINRVGVFTHSIPIKCLLAGLLNCSPTICSKVCIDDSSVTVLQHSVRAGWRIKRLNDTTHLRLL
ncbi:uncharacterized protein [Typha latifolia]|uniref:uncharacterized protein n=1 Tax=Typha latifolia TaxID=4733 RepID=UPI003C2C5808